MQRKDYYEILGVARDADERVIKMAYRRLALRNHPDTNREDPQAADRFKEINEAYDVLSHTEKRNQYDLGRDPFTGGSPFRSPRFDSRGDPFEENFSSQFRCRGGGFGRALGRRQNRHIHDFALSSEEASKGTERDIRLHTGMGSQVFTVSIPAGVGDGSLFNFKFPAEGGQEIEFLFRVRIAG